MVQVPANLQQLSLTTCQTLRGDISRDSATQTVKYRGTSLSLLAGSAQIRTDCSALEPATFSQPVLLCDAWCALCAITVGVLRGRSESTTQPCAAGSTVKPSVVVIGAKPEPSIFNQQNVLKPSDWASGLVKDELLYFGICWNAKQHPVAAVWSTRIFYCRFLALLAGRVIGIQTQHLTSYLL